MELGKVSAFGNVGLTCFDPLLWPTWRVEHEVMTTGDICDTLDDRQEEGFTMMFPDH